MGKPETKTGPAKDDGVEDRVAKLLLFLYRRGGSQIFFDVTDLPNDGSPLPDPEKEGADRALSFSGDIIKNPSPGQVFKFDMSPNSKTVFFTRNGKAWERFADTWANDSDVARYRAIDSATKAEEAAEKALKADAATKYHLQALDDLRAAYRKLPAPARQQLLAIIVRYLTA